MRSKMRKLFIFFATVASVATIQAERTDKLIITGNYTRHRLLAELIQWEKDNVPIILVSPTEHKNQFYFLTGTQPGQIPYAEEFSMRYLTDFLDQLDPQTVVIIGDEAIVGKNVMTELKNRKVLTTVIDSTNWNTNVEKAQSFFKTTRISRPFKQLTNEYYSLSRNKALTKDTNTEEPNNDSDEDILSTAVESPKEVVPAEPEVIEPEPKAKLSVESEVKVNAPKK